MGKYDAVHAEIAELKTVRASVGLLLDRLFADFLANKDDPAQIEAIVKAGREQREAFTADVVRNTPVATEPPPPPPVEPPVVPPADPSARRQ